MCQKPRNAPVSHVSSEIYIFETLVGLVIFSGDSAVLAMDHDEELSFPNALFYTFTDPYVARCKTTSWFGVG